MNKIFILSLALISISTAYRPNSIIEWDISKNETKIEYGDNLGIKCFFQAPSSDTYNMRVEPISGDIYY